MKRYLITYKRQDGKFYFYTITAKDGVEALNQWFTEKRIGDDFFEIVTDLYFTN